MRNPDGTFKKGNNGGPGRPKGSHVKRLKVLERVCSLQEWQEICITAVENAKGGDFRARDWLSKYLVPDKVLEEMAKQEQGEPMPDPSELRQEYRRDPAFVDWVRHSASSEN